MPRKKPFSGKQKKFQLKAKRQEKTGTGRHDGKPPVADKHDESSNSDDSSNEAHSHSSVGKRSTGRPPKPTNKNTKDRYKLSFQEQSREELLESKQRSMLPYERRSEEEMEAGVELFYNPPIMFPTRPAWNPGLSTAQLEQQEHRYFQSYCEQFLRDHSLGYVELNLETWRQLWRVLEMSDVLLHIVDVRFVPLHFNPELYDYVTKQLSKQMMVVLNKCDIVPPHVAIAWKHYLLQEFPELDVVIFTSYPKDEITREALTKGKQSRRRRKKTTAVGPLELWSVCHKLTKQEINIDSWKTKILEDMKVVSDDVSDSDQSDVEVTESSEVTSKPDLGYTQHERFKNGILTIGCIGYPNVGKSSVINGLMGRKVVSISKTPGHTKHFQTIFLTSNVRLCDCPGLVFPSTAPRAVQVLAGMYPVAQLREPYSVVQYLAERSDMPASLNLRLPEDEQTWSAYLICDELAELKGFKTARGARTDPYRAANWILRASLEGKIMSYLLPPQFTSRKSYWLSHAETKWLGDMQLERISVANQSQTDQSAAVSQSSDESSSDSESGEAVASHNAFSLLSDDC